MKYLLFLLLIINNVFVNAQHPAYTLFGVDQFTNVNIYDVIQDDDDNYFFATDQGLILHNGYTFKQLLCKEMKGFSLFGFTKDTKGDIYCFNLHHQIFKIRNDKITLFYEVPTELKYREIWLTTNEQDDLIIQTKGLIKLSNDGKNETIISPNIFEKSTPINFQKLDDNRTISVSTDLSYVIQDRGTLLELTSETIKSHLIDRKNFGLTWIPIQDKFYAIERHSHLIFLFNPTTNKFKLVNQLNNIHSQNGLRIYTTFDKIWVTGSFNGAYIYDKHFKPLFNGELVYTDYFISDIVQDSEGNTLLSTFDDGILVIQNNDISSFSPKDEKITCLSSDNDKTLFIGTDKGNIYTYDNQTSNLIYGDEQKTVIEFVSFWQGADLLLHSYNKGLRVSKWQNNRCIPITEENLSIKHGFFPSATQGFLAFNSGISSISIENNNIVLNKIEKLKRRAHCVAEAKDTKTIYASLASGCTALYTNGKCNQIKIDGQVIYSNSLLSSKEKIIIGTRNNGILLLVNDKIVKHIPFPGRIRKMQIYNDDLYVLSETGLFRSSLNSVSFEALNNSNGINCVHISDFYILGNKLYVSDSKSLDCIDIKRIDSKSQMIPVSISRVYVNDSLSLKNNLDDHQHKIKFEFSLKTIKHRSNVVYKFKLDGYDENWSTQPYENNSITYNALPPGNYTFLLKSVNGNFESPIVKHVFKINAPFYQKLWFYILITLLSGLCIGLFFNIRIKKIRQKNRERLEKQQIQTDLLESELKALRSQMNPHFIFNSLNSIQDLILKEDTDASYDYIVLFSELVRSTLNYSNQDFIPIEKEIEFLNVYLSLEKLRFKDEFQYRITQNKVQGIKVPSLLIQPFIENALLHGLLHKDGIKTLKISFTLDSQLTCIIEDNGIGREKSKKIKERQGSHHQSFALKAIEKRLEILKNQNHENVGYTVEDLYENGEAIGTRVIVKVPFQRLF